MTGREQAMADFLAACGHRAARPALLAGDASFRKYYRLRGTDGSAVLMEAPPPEEDVRPFMAVAGHLLHLGFSAPRILAADKAAGFLLLEDLGDDSFSNVIAAAPGKATALYGTAVDLLVKMQAEAPPERLAVDDQEAHHLPAYDRGLLLQEAALFTDWYLPALTGDAGAGADLAALLEPMLKTLERDTPALVLRDYHADNLMWLAERKGLQRIGLLDFQDAVVGHPAYDLVSLLQDARRDVPESLETAMIERYLEARKMAGDEIDVEAFGRAYALLGVQRNAKIIGIFTRLWKRDGKPGYLAMIPRVWGLLERSLRHGGFAELRSFFDSHAPAKARHVAPWPEALH